MLREIHDERLILLIRIHILYDTDEGLEEFLVLCKRDWPGVLCERIHQYRRAEVVGGGGGIGAEHELAPGLRILQSLLRELTAVQVDERARGAALIQEEEHLAIADGEADAREYGQAPCPFHQLEGLGEVKGLEGVANDAVVQKDGHGSTHEFVIHLRARDDPAAAREECYEGLRVGGDGEHGHQREILGDSDARSARCLVRAEIAVLARVELARAGEFHARVKVEHDAAGVAHEIQIGDAGEALEDAGLLVTVAECSTAAAAARNPVALEAA